MEFSQFSLPLRAYRHQPSRNDYRTAERRYAHLLAVRQSVRLHEKTRSLARFPFEHISVGFQPSPLCRSVYHAHIMAILRSFLVNCSKASVRVRYYSSMSDKVSESLKAPTPPPSVRNRCKFTHAHGVRTEWAYRSPWGLEVEAVLPIGMAAAHIAHTRTYKLSVERAKTQHTHMRALARTLAEMKVELMCARER